MAYCSACGADYSFGAERCPRCGQSVPVLPPVTLAQGSAGAVDVRARRAFAGLVDVGIATVLTGVLLRLLLARFAVRTRLLLFVVSLAAAVAPAAYLILRDSLGGKSVGKLLVGLVVINPVRRKRGGFTDSVLRNLVFGFAVVPVIGWVIVLVLFGISAVAIVRGKGIRIGEGLTDARVMDDRSAELEL